jgi:hypothetical protein
LDSVFQRFTGPHPVSGNQLIERPARHVLHHDEIQPILAGDVVDSHEMGVIESRGGLGLLDEPPAALGIAGLVRGKDFDRDKTVQVRVACTVDDPHPTFADLVEHFVVGNPGWQRAPLHIRVQPFPSLLHILYGKRGLPARGRCGVR